MDKVLLIEDDAQLRKLLRIQIEKMGFEFIGVNNGCEGVRLLPVVKPDIVMTDIVIPDKDGLEIIKEIKNRHKQIIIIAISGESGIGSESFSKLALELGADFFLKKPIDRTKLAELLTGIVNRISSEKPAA